MSEQSAIYKARDWPAGSSMVAVPVKVSPGMLHDLAKSVAENWLGPEKLCTVTVFVRVEATRCVTDEADKGGYATS